MSSIRTNRASSNGADNGADANSLVKYERVAALGADRSIRAAFDAEDILDSAEIAD